MRLFNSQLLSLDHDLEVGGGKGEGSLRREGLAAAKGFVWGGARTHTSSHPHTPHTLIPHTPTHVQAWRARQGRNMDFTLLDRANRAGWDLATKLLAKRNVRRGGCCGWGGVRVVLCGLGRECERARSAPGALRGANLRGGAPSPCAPQSLNRGRFSVDQALRHRFMSPGLFGG